jgi:hypothetical protein
MTRAVFSSLAIAAWLAAPAMATQLVNGDFETGNATPPQGWSFDQAGWSQNPGIGALETADPTVGVWNSNVQIDGTKAAHKSYAGEINGSYWIYQVFPTVPGQEYQVSGYYSGGVGGLQDFLGFGAWWEVGLIDGAYSNAAVDGPGPGVVIAKTEITTIPPTGSGFGWTPVSSQFTATGNSAVIYLKYGGVGNFNYFGANFDGFSVVAVPEPATMLLALAGLPLLRRRRR